MTHTHVSIVLAFALAAGAGCGAPTGDVSGTRSALEARWTPAQLGKLDASLRTRIERSEHGRVAIKVFFHELPSEGELAELLLNRMGRQAIGNVDALALHRIAARRDVERIEEISDVGYQ